MTNILVRLPDYVTKAMFCAAILDLRETDRHHRDLLKVAWTGVSLSKWHRAPLNIRHDAKIHSMLRLKTIRQMWKPVYSFSSFA